MEIRALINLNPPGENTEPLWKINEEKGIYVSIDLSILIEKVIIAPNAESWFKEIVESVSKKYGLDKYRVPSNHPQ